MTTSRHEPNDAAPSRWAYGEELRLRREGAGHTQQSLADVVICSPSMIAHIEAGRRKPRLEDARRLDQVLGKDGFFERFLPTLNDVKVAAHFAAAAEAEKLAVSIREYAPSLVPGLLQTDAYARAVFRAFKPNTSPEDVDSRVVNRLQRARLLDDPDQPEMWVLLEETVLRRVVGGPAIMAEQLRHIAELSERGRVRVHVLPFSSGAHALMEGMLAQMRFTDAPPLAYVEGVRTGQVLDDPALVDDCQAAYALALSDALPQRESIALLRLTAEEYEDHEQH